MRAAFALAKSFKDQWVLGIAGQEESAQPLNSQDFPLAEKSNSGGDGVVHPEGLSLLVTKLYLRPTVRTGVGLSVEPPVGWVVIFMLTFWTHAELGHGGFRPIVRDILDDGKPGPAVRAVGKRVSIPAILGVENLLLARLAGGDVRRNKLVLSRLFHTFPDFKGTKTHRG